MMNTSDKALIDTSLVRRLIATQFPQWAELDIKPIKCTGWDNRTFHLGKTMLIRLPSGAEYSQQVEKEQRWLPKLAPQLSLPIPIPLAMGKPGEGYPWHWSIYRWIEGETASIKNIENLSNFATSLAQFLITLQHVDATGGPVAGPHNFYRGGPLITYDAETRQAITILGNKIDTDRITAIWNTALASSWQDAPVWVHGDIAIGNLLVKEGRLNAVIDFGQLGIGDPACDLAIAWTFFKGQSREAFRTTLRLDNATWERGRGWALWKALIVYAQMSGTNPLDLEKSRIVLNEILNDF